MKGGLSHSENMISNYTLQTRLVLQIQLFLECSDKSFPSIWNCWFFKTDSIPENKAVSVHFLWKSFSKPKSVKVRETRNNLAVCLFAYQGPGLTCSSQICILDLAIVTGLFALFYLFIHALYNNVQKSQT